ncbi:autoinducer binding domain-containing protein [Pseudomonas alkylphenolica]|uniref:LuxR family transcriptional regulator n=1 Tax=Pseudomonas alkylphenolica TaxID=237609 RepID=A0A077F9V4_9PSED|nr:autoinducer binding domain-containing protein [Pseudomonas alkylphenolica]AIL62192.1 LuxR family transcriptional regulator [Pseudomonas alkylphenolica]
MKNRTAAQPQRLLDNLPLLVKKLGFDYYAFTFISPDQQTYTTNYPASWLEHYNRCGYAARDPIPALCQTSSLPLLWAAETFDSAEDIWIAAQAYDLHHGWVQPIHSQQTRSSLSVLRPHTSVSREEFYAKAEQVMLLGAQLHQAAAYFSPFTHITSPEHRLD